LNRDDSFERDDASEHDPTVESDEKPAVEISTQEKEQLDQFFLKFIDKLFKIYNKLNVKVVSLSVLKQELTPFGDRSILNLLEALSGNLNKVSNHISTSLKETDHEISQYKNIQSKLRKEIVNLE